MSALVSLRDRLRALPLDRAPLRRAGVLSALLVALLAAGQWLGPSPRPARAADPGRHDVRAATEDVSAWTPGRALALVLLLAGGGAALWLHQRRAPGAAGRASALDVLETHSLGPSHSLRLVACGGEVLLLSVGAEGARVLREWPRDRFEAAAAPPTPTAPFADVLAEASQAARPALEDVEPVVALTEKPAVAPPPATDPPAPPPEWPLGHSDGTQDRPAGGDGEAAAVPPFAPLDAWSAGGGAVRLDDATPLPQFTPAYA